MPSETNNKTFVLGCSEAENTFAILKVSTVTHKKHRVFRDKIQPMATANLAINTIEYITALENAGIPEKQAKVHAEALARVIDNNLATKQDVENVHVELKRDIEILRKDLLLEMNKQAWKSVAFTVTGIGLLMAFFKFFH